MITREEAEDYAVELIQSDDELNTIKLALYSVRIIDKIYMSIGTCETCWFYKPLGLNKRLICTKTNLPKDNNGYCDEYLGSPDDN